VLQIIEEGLVEGALLALAPGQESLAFPLQSLGLSGGLWIRLWKGQAMAAGELAHRF
jgi:hypothetical protein